MSISQIYDQIKTKYSITSNLFSITDVTEITLNPGSSPSNITKVLKVDEANTITKISININDSTHIIPFLDHETIISISNSNDINNSFAKYQFYNYLYNNPGSMNSLINVNTIIKQYFDKDTSYTFTSSTHLDHYNMINNTVINKSDYMEYLYVLKELSLIELYIKLLGIGLDAKDKDSNFTFDEITQCIVNNHVNNLNNSMTFHYLKTTYESANSKLTVSPESESDKSIYFFKELNPEYHIIYDPESKKNHSITNTIPLSTSGAINSYINSYSLPSDLSTKLENDKIYIILYKTDVYAQNEYNSKKQQLKEKNKLLLENKDELEKEKSNNNQIYSNYNQINIIYYLTYVIVFIVIIGMLSTNSEKSRIVRSLLLLMIVIVIYLILLSYINLKEYYNKELFTSSNDVDVADNLIKQSLNNILMNSPIIGKINLYNEFTNIMHKDTNKLDRNNLILDSNINRTIQNTSTGWHEKYQKSLFIHTVFLLMIVILLYLWLMSIMPELNIYLFIVTIIACMVLIFYYFTSLHRVVRSTYKQKYWTKMEINK